MDVHIDLDDARIAVQNYEDGSNDSYLCGGWRRTR